MKNTLYIILFLLSTTTHAQTLHPVWVTLGNISSFNMVNNRPAPVTTTCEAMLANPVVLVKNPADACEVARYTFSISSAKNPVVKGPFPISGAALSDTAVKLIKEYAGDSGTVFIEKIKLNCEDGVRSGKSVVLKFAR